MMNTQRIFGAVLLVVGIILLIIGLNASDSISDQVSEAFTGRFTRETMWYIIGGAAAGLLGLLLMLFGSRRGRA
jgi:uncharacterized membrane protein